MKKILSIFMVAVLSLNLLYQPCMADDGKKESVLETSQTDKPSGKAIKAKAEEQQREAMEKIVGVIMCIMCILFGGLLAAGAYFSANEDSYGNKHSYGSKHSYWDYKSGYENGFRDGVNKCAAKQTGDTFPIDKMSKKCLRQMLAWTHPDKFGCYEYIKDFYMKVQKSHEKEK